MLFFINFVLTTYNKCATMVLSLGRKGKDMGWKLTKALMKKEREIAKLKVKCKNCGCVSLITPKRDWCICRWCGNKVYRTDQIEFRYNVEEKMKGKRK